MIEARFETPSHCGIRKRFSKLTTSKHIVLTASHPSRYLLPSRAPISPCAHCTFPQFRNKLALNDASVSESDASGDKWTTCRESPDHLLASFVIWPILFIQSIFTSAPSSLSFFHFPSFTFLFLLLLRVLCYSKFIFFLIFSLLFYFHYIAITLRK